MKRHTSNCCGNCTEVIIFFCIPNEIMMATIIIQRERKKKNPVCFQASIAVVKKLGGTLIQMFWCVVMLPHFCLMNNEEGNILCPVILREGCQTHSYFLYMLFLSMVSVTGIDF